MLYGLLIFLFSIICIFLIIIVLVQKGKSSMGMGSLGGGTQLLFGGSGGQDLFQKITWVLGFIFMSSSLILALLKEESSGFITRATKQIQNLVNTETTNVSESISNKEPEKQQANKSESEVAEKTENNQDIEKK